MNVKYMFLQSLEAYPPIAFSDLLSVADSPGLLGSGQSNIYFSIARVTKEGLGDSFIFGFLS